MTGMGPQDKSLAQSKDLSASRKRNNKKKVKERLNTAWGQWRDLQ